MILDPSRGIRTSSPGSPSATTSALRRSVPPAGPRRHEWVGVPADTAPNRFRPRSRRPEALSGGRPLIPGTVGAEREYDRMWIRPTRGWHRQFASAWLQSFRARWLTGGSTIAGPGGLTADLEGSADGGPSDIDLACLVDKVVYGGAIVVVCGLVGGLRQSVTDVRRGVG